MDNTFPQTATLSKPHHIPCSPFFVPWSPVSSDIHADILVSYKFTLQACPEEMNTTQAFTFDLRTMREITRDKSSLIKGSFEIDVGFSGRVFLCLFRCACPTGVEN